MSLESKTIGIVGGGVAGLATGRALALRGAKATVYERAPAIAEVGAGLQISPNGRRALDALGLQGAVAEVAVRAEGTRLIDAMTNRVVVEIAATEPAYFVHRARLIEVLEQGAIAAGVELVTGATRSPDDVDGDIVIGADGLRSSFRTALNPSNDPRFTGQVAWRAVIRDPTAPPVAEVYMGPGRHLVSYPLAGGLRNIVACEDRAEWTAEGWTIENRPMSLRAAFSRFPDKVQGWLADVSTVYLWGLFRHPVAARWADGQMALVGDAAHPTLPYLAQGANLALEDAVILARALAGPGLSAYQAARYDRVQRVVETATQNAWKFHLSNGAIRQAAFAGLRLRERLSPGAAGRSFSWVWDYNPATAPL